MIPQKFVFKVKEPNIWTNWSEATASY